MPDKITLNKTLSGGGEGTSGGGDVGVTHIPAPQSGLIISSQRFEAMNETTRLELIIVNDQSELSIYNAYSLFSNIVFLQCLTLMYSPEVYMILNYTNEYKD